ncbi:MAG: DUF4399 domain-containing protein [Ardenticatenaceae bacterium]|nr:DUF4399 domain-containing protein [Ardenticatenaceae bacterium]
MCRLSTFTLLALLVLGPVVPVAAQGPQLILVAPKNGELINGTDVAVNFETSGIKLVPSTVPLAEAGKRPEANRPGEGHVHFMFDLQPLVVWEHPEPYTFSNVPPGEHQLTVELVNNDHSPLSPPVVQVVQFRTGGAPQVMPTTGGSTLQLPGVALALLALAGLALSTGGFALRRRQP